MHDSRPPPSSFRAIADTSGRPFEELRLVRSLLVRAACRSERRCPWLVTAGSLGYLGGMVTHRVGKVSRGRVVIPATDLPEGTEVDVLLRPRELIELTAEEHRLIDISEREFARGEWFTHEEVMAGLEQQRATFFAGLQRDGEAKRERPVRVVARKPRRGSKPGGRRAGKR